ncbi:MAG: hypothetical protein FJ335_13765 [Sphingomonadales bacterium]|nr:hypothetical protein [Sphingomonadales bacterium]
MHVIDRDRYVVAHCANQIEQAIRGREWLTQGRGPYEWDDDRFYEEFADAVEAIREAAKPLAIVAWDKSDCTRIAERVNAARLAARELLAKPIGPREMVAADIFGDPRDAEIARLRKLVDDDALSPTHTVSDMGVDAQRGAEASADEFASITAGEAIAATAGNDPLMRDLSFAKVAVAARYPTAAAIIERAQQALSDLTADKPEDTQGLLDWLSDKHRLSLQHHSPMYGDDDDQSYEWRVERESGSINDREWDTVGRGATPAVAIAAARAALVREAGDRSNG